MIWNLDAINHLAYLLLGIFISSLVVGIVLAIYTRKKILKKLLENKSQTDQLIINILYFIVFIPLYLMIILWLIIAVMAFGQI
jgi:hypothetical protein